MTLVWMIADSLEKVQVNAYIAGPFPNPPEDGGKDYVVTKNQAGETLFIRQGPFFVMNIPSSHPRPKGGEWKVILIDNYDRETISDILVCEFINKEDAEDLKVYLEEYCRGSERWPRVVHQTHRLSCGMADIVGID